MKLEIDHIVPVADGGTVDIANAIPVCFNCHAEIHAYNDRHPRGRKYKPEELRQHRESWLAICEQMPAQLVSAPLGGSVGPLQAMVDEVEYNLTIARANKRPFFPLETSLFRGALQAGALSVLAPSLKDLILDTYGDIDRWNHNIRLLETVAEERSGFMQAATTYEIRIQDALSERQPLADKLAALYRALLSFLGSDIREA